MNDIWNAILDFISQFVIPDWGALVALIPVGLFVLVVLWLLLTIRKFATAGPTRRGRRRVTPLPPPGVHLPGPSFAPIVASIGMFLLLFGLVFGGSWIWVGLVGVAISLLYWGREALADYDRVVHAERLPAAVHGPPPPGVHLPGPSFRPVLASLALMVFFFGLVFGGWLLPVGILFLIVTLVGWLFDARHEYVNRVEADRTGHLESLSAPEWPKRVLTVFAVLVVFAVVVDLGILPPRGSTAVGGEGGEGPGASGAPPGSPPPALEGDIVLVAKDVKFNLAEVSAPADKPFTIAFDNQDSGVPHDVAIRNDSGIVYNGEDVTGPGQVLDEVPGLAAGTYTFFCTFHANMTGTLTAGE
ncbi:MAG TPA: cytochrome c oxidase subunit 4 [Candidatus Limnocylindrales bacterium]|nr:cytochrome c oxidase subunit 4 [Candidatus Limnocylindrales bacterium]